MDVGLSLIIHTHSAVVHTMRDNVVAKATDDVKSFPREVMRVTSVGFLKEAQAPEEGARFPSHQNFESLHQMDTCC